MSELVVGSIAGLAANSYVVDVASGSTLDLSAGAVFPAGNIIQVVRATDSTDRSTNSTSFVDTNLSVTITPKSATSKILLLASARANIAWNSGGTSVGLAFVSITDSANNDISGGAPPVGLILSGFASAQNLNNYQSLQVVAWDEPATTSSTTYKLRFSVHNSAVTFNLENSLTVGQLYAIEVAG